jgi:glutathione synthase
MMGVAVAASGVGDLLFPLLLGGLVVFGTMLGSVADREREICTRIGPYLKQMGLLFVGIDVIDGHLTEINVTSPTGVRAIKRLGGPDLAVSIWECIEDKLGRR